MSSPYRLATNALLETTPRKVTFTSFRRFAVLSSTAHSTYSPNVPETFDIFDAPVKLREGDPPNEPSKAPKFFSIARHSVTSRAGSSKSIHHDALDLPWSLPPPVTFDGPACPLHMSPSTLKWRRLQRQSLTRSFPTTSQGSSTVSYSALTSQPETLYLLFDGPSRLTRFQYSTLENERYPFTYLSLALCSSIIFGWLSLEENLEHSSERSP